MPRRNRPRAPRRTHAPATRTPRPTLERMAHDLVERGLASRQILESPWGRKKRDETTETPGAGPTRKPKHPQDPTSPARTPPRDPLPLVEKPPYVCGSPDGTPA